MRFDFELHRLDYLGMQVAAVAALNTCTPAVPLHWIQPIMHLNNMLWWHI